MRTSLLALLGMAFVVRPLPARAIETPEAAAAQAGVRFDLGAIPQALPAVGTAAGNEPAVRFSPAATHARRSAPSRVPPAPKGAARVVADAAGIVGGALGAFAGAAYVATGLLPVVLSFYLFVGDREKRNYGQILVDHVISPITWGARAFKHAKRAALDALR